MTRPRGTAPRVPLLPGGNGAFHHRPPRGGTAHRARGAEPAGAIVADGEERVRALPHRLGEPATGSPAVPDGRGTVLPRPRPRPAGGAPAVGRGGGDER